MRAHYLVLVVFVYFMKLQLKFRDSALFLGFRFKSAIPRIPRVFRDRGKSLALLEALPHVTISLTISSTFHRRRWNIVDIVDDEPATHNDNVNDADVK